MDNIMVAPAHVAERDKVTKQAVTKLVRENVQLKGEISLVTQRAALVYQEALIDSALKGTSNVTDDLVKLIRKDPSLKTACDFEYSGNLIETMLLGLVAYRAGKKISYDANAGTTGDKVADALLKKEYRKGWTLDG